MAKTISSLNVVLGATVSPFTNAFKTAENAAQSFTSRIASVGSAIVTLTGAGLALGALEGIFDRVFEIPTRAFEEAKQQADVQARLAAVLKATGNAAGFSADQLSQQADALSRSTTVDDDAILNFQAVLATFKNISGDAFRDTTRLALDMNAVLGGDLQGTAIQLGKALNDPAEGLTALRRVGVSFTDQQVAQIQAMQTAGNLAGAQALILAELRSEFGGAAEAMAKTPFGQLTQLGNRFLDTLKPIGHAMAVVGVGFAAAFDLRGGLARVTAGLDGIQGVIQTKVDTYAPMVAAAVGNAYGRAVAIVESVYGAVEPVVAGLYTLITGGVRDIVGYVSDHAPAVAVTFSNIFVAIEQQLAPLIGVVSREFASVYGAVTTAAGAVYAYLAPVVEAWTATANAGDAVHALVSAASTAYVVYKAWNTAIFASTAAQAAFTAAVWLGSEAAGAAQVGMAGIIAASRVVATAQAAATIAIEVAQTATLAIASSNTIAAAAAAAWNAVQWAGAAASAAAATAYEGVGAALIVAKLAGSEYVATVVAEAVALPALTAAVYVADAALGVLAATQWAAEVAFDAGRAAVVATYVAVETWTAAQFAATAAAAAGTAAQWLYSAAMAAGQAVVATAAAVFDAASIASAAWAAATGVATAAQWLLNAALTANPIGIVVVAVGALAVGLGVVVARFVDVAAVMAWVKTAFDVAVYAVTHWQDSLKLAGIEVALFAVRSASQIGWAFTQAIPTMLTWLAGHWREVFTDIMDFTASVFQNLLTNASNFGTAIWAAIQGDGFSFEWTPLTEGFKSAMTELPKIADRQVGPLEQKLAASADAIAQKFRDGLKGQQTPVAPNAADAMKKATDDANKVLGQTKPAVLPPPVIPPPKPPVMDTKGVTQPLAAVTEAAKSAQQAVQGLDAVVSGSAASMKNHYATIHAAAQTAFGVGGAAAVGGGNSLVNPTGSADTLFAGVSDWNTMRPVADAAASNVAAPMTGVAGTLIAPPSGGPTAAGGLLADPGLAFPKTTNENAKPPALDKSRNMLLQQLVDAAKKQAAPAPVVTF